MHWEEVVLVKDYIVEIDARFYFENIVTRFGFLKELMSDKG